MEHFKTPVRKLQNTSASLTIPTSPFLKKLGYGTGVMVYKLDRSPIDNKTRSPWAIKKVNKATVLQSQFGKRLKEEMDILRKLEHTNIIGFRAVVKAPDGQDCLAMEECSGCLGDMIEERNDGGLLAFPANNIMKVALDMSEALNYLHNTALLLHCDIKSYNVLIKGDFEICKLCDFGVSLPLDKNGEIDRIKAGDEEEYVGTKIWSAPEILGYPQIITAKADIFSYGLVLWEMLALAPPVFENLDDTESSISEEPIEISRTRPDLPLQEFDDTYIDVLTLFHVCTEEDYQSRPSAQDLTACIKKMICS